MGTHKFQRCFPEDYLMLLAPGPSQNRPPGHRGHAVDVIAAELVSGPHVDVSAARQQQASDTEVVPPFPIIRLMISYLKGNGGPEGGPTTGARQVDGGAVGEEKPRNFDVAVPRRHQQWRQAY